MKVFRSPGVYTVMVRVKHFTMYPRCTSCMKFLMNFQDWDMGSGFGGLQTNIDVCCSGARIEYVSEMGYIRDQRELKIKEIEN